MAIVGVDIDDTLYDFGSEVREAFFELSIIRDDKELLKGTYSGFNEWRELSDVFDWDTVSEAIEYVHERQLEQVPYKNADRVVRRLAEKHTVIYVSSRHESHRENTCIWLVENGFPLTDHRRLVCSSHEKEEHLKQAQYLIDDRPYTVVNFLYDFTWKHTHGSNNMLKERRAFGLWTAYNRNLTDINNVYLAPTWRGLEYYLEKKGVL